MFYAREYVPKPGRDVRVLAADGEPVAATTRSSGHRITSVATGGTTAPFEVDETVGDLVGRASRAVVGLLGVDLVETGDAPNDCSGARGPASQDGYTVHGVNSACEWKGLNEAVPDVDVPARIVDRLEERAAAMA